MDNSTPHKKQNNNCTKTNTNITIVNVQRYKTNSTDSSCNIVEDVLTTNDTFWLMDL